ncbi:DUF1194 domain-containing protein [Chloroflexota bacterium]
MSRGGRITRIVMMLFVLCLMIGTSIGLSGTTASADPGLEAQLCIVMDGSGSIEPQDWAIIIAGLANAVENHECTPQDGSLELSIVVFGWQREDAHAVVALAPTVITSANIDAVTDSIRAIEQPPYGSTPMACGIRLAADILYASPNFDPALKQVINLVTDGIPNICCDTYDGYLCGPEPYWPPSWLVYASTVEARNYAIAKLEMEPLHDEIDAEYIGIPGEYVLPIDPSHWLRDNIVWPQPGYFQPPYNGKGWVRVVDTAQEAADTFCEKILLLVERTLTMQVNGCGDTTPAIGAHLYTPDSVVDISAAPCPGWEFVGWTGDVANPSSPTTTVAMDTDKIVTANFAKVPRTLTMQVNGCGTTSPVVGAHVYEHDTVVDISADHCPGWEFVNWTGDVANPSSPTTTVTMNSDKTVTANFSEITPTLTMQVDGCGTTLPVVGSHIYSWGTVVGISAEPCPGWTFDGWTGDVADPNSPATTVTVDSDKTVTAHFLPPVNLTMQVDGCGVTTPAIGDHSYQIGSVVQISATACPLWAFDSWTGDVADPDSQVTTVTMDSDKTVTAHFLGPATLTLQVNGCGMTTPYMGGYIYPPNTVVDISALACPGWQFDNWTGDVADPNALATTVTINADKTVTANFSEMPSDLSAQLAVIIDGSSSINAEEWAAEKDGLYNAVINGIVPRNGMIELTVIQFAGGSATTEVPPTIIDDTNWATVATQISSIVKRNGITPLAAGIKKGWEEILGSPNYGFAAKEIINICSDIGEYTIAGGKGSVEVERDLAVTVKGIDEISAEGLGDITSVDMEWLRDSIVWPQPGSIAPPYTPGWVLKVDNAAEFETAISKKVPSAAELTHALIAGSDRGGSVTEPGEGIFTYSAGTVVNLTATPDTGWVFDYWTGNVADPSSATTTITMNNYKSVTAYFARSYTLAVGSGAGGSVTEPGEGAFVYSEDTVVTLTAVPELGWEFNGWTGNVANPSSPATTITMNQNQTVTANFFEIPTYTLMVSSAPGGSVTEPGEGAFVYNEDTVVTLTAVPELGWEFNGWTGNVANPSASATTITMNQDQTVTANFFEIPTYTLMASSTPGGSITEPGEGAFVYNEGIVVTLTAILELGWEFDGWTGNVANPSSLTTTITMNQDQTVKAYFSEIPTYYLAIGSTLCGQVTEPGEGAFPYSEGAVVTLIATPETGCAFDGWTGNVADPLSETTTITMNTDKAVTAKFVKTYELAVSSGEGGSITEPGEGTFTFKQDKAVVLKATPSHGWAFDSWTGNVANPTSATTFITMTQNETVSANFIKTYLLAVSSSAGGSITSPGEGLFEYKIGTVVDLTAVPGFGHTFIHWTGNVVNPSSTTTSITMYQNEVVVANFSGLTTHTLTTQVVGNGTVSPAAGQHEFTAGTVVNLIATPNEGNAFSIWTGDVANKNSAITTVTIDSDKTVTANFVDTFTLTMQVSGSGSITPAVGEHSYPVGTVIDISASPNPGSRFDNWTGDVASASSPITTVTMDSNKTVKAHFSDITSGNALVLNTNGSGGTSPPVGSHLYAPGAVVTITASPNSGWEFSNWTGNVAAPLSATTTVTMSQNRVVTAYFRALPGGVGGPPSTITTPTPSPTVRPTSPPTLMPTTVPTTSPTPVITPVTTPTLTPVPTAPPTPTPTPILTPPPFTPTPTPEDTSAEVPWVLIIATIAAVMGVGGLFFVLRGRAG